MSEPVKLNPPELTEELLTDQEANDLLGNGILVETNGNVICMSLNEAISSDMNLSPEGLRKVATQLIIQQNIKVKKPPIPNLRMTCDSDGGFSSECSDSTYTTTGSSTSYPSFAKFSSFSNEIHLNSMLNRPKDRDKSSEESDSTRGSLHLLNSGGCPSPQQLVIKKKGRGGWPKGRKRKPELLNLPPKAPLTGYNLYTNEQRSLFKDTDLKFYEITKIVGNRWSSLTLEEKKPYLDRAEEEKRQYKEALKQYRQSEAYRAYLNKKRRKRLQNNVLSESDMDATDDFDEEDNEELYCRTCDQWFHSLHNKREHLQAKKHLTSLAGDIYRELSDMESSTGQAENSAVSLDESSLEGLSFNANTTNTESDCSNSTNVSIYEAMCRLKSLVQKREAEVRALKVQQQEVIQEQTALYRQFNQLNEREAALQKELAQKREKEKELESIVFQLWQVPSLFVMAKFDNPDHPSTDFSEGFS